MCLGRLRGAGEGAPKLATPKNGAVLGARGEVDKANVEIHKNSPAKKKKTHLLQE
jgi:hypothetical protein